MKKLVLFSLFSSITLLSVKIAYSQILPVISYNVPKTFSTGTPISPLSPILSGGATYPGIYSQPALFASFDTPFSITIDGLNNVYATDNTTGNVLKFDPAGNNIATFNTGNAQASEVAVDRLGNVYVSQFTANSVLKYSSSGTLIATITGFNDPYGIAFDAANNAYVADYLSGNILKIAANDTIATTYLTGFTNPYGLAIDANDNIYVGEQSVGDIIKIAGGTTNKTVFALGFNGPRHLNKDNFGNIYIADYGNNAIKRVNPAGVITTILNAGVSSPRQAAFDSNGNIFFADYGSNTLQKSEATIFSISNPLPLGLNFDVSTGQISGTPATALDSTKFTITASNTGGTSSTTITINIMAPPQVFPLPVATAMPATSVNQNSANINGFANSNGDKKATVGFVYGLNSDLSDGVTTIIPASSCNNVEAGTTVTLNATGLIPGSSYYYKVIATNASGTVSSSIASFRTLAPVKSNDASLNSLTLKQSTLSPRFSPNIKVYTDTVVNTVTNIQIVALAGDANATVTINSAPVTNGDTSAPIDLTIGNNTVVIIITAEDGITKNTYTLNIFKQKAQQTISFPSFATKTYGDSDFSPNATANSGSAVVYTNDNPAVARIIDGKIHIISAGTANITSSQSGDANVNTAPVVTQTLTINKAALTVTAASSNIAYGQPLPALTFSYSGFVNGDDPGKLTAPVSISTSASLNSPVGAYPINLSSGVSDNYSFNYQPGILTIGQNNSSISFAALPSKTYGDNDFILTSSSTSGLPVNYTSSDNNVATVTGNILHITGAGTAVITAAQQANTNYTTAGSVAQIFTVNKAHLTIAANNINIAYGQTIPPLTATYTGFVNGDKATSLTSPAIISTGASANAAAGTYPITVSGAASNNYDIAYHPGTLTIGQNNSSITFTALAAKTYGDSDFDLTAVSTSGLPVTYTSSDNAIATVTGNTLHIIGAGSVSITASQTGNGNYTAAESVTQTLIVNKATLAITADAQDKTYGDNDQVLTYKIASGTLFNGDAFTGLLTRDAGEQAGIYDIKQGTVALTKNYILNYTPAKLTINKAEVTIRANNASITYGQAIPALTVTYSGFVNGDNPGKLIATIAVNTTATATSTTGNYPITVNGAASNNYLFNYQPGILTISQSNSSIIFAALSAKTYGDADFALDATSTAGLPVTYVSSDNHVAIVSGNTLHIIGAGTAIITATQQGNINYTAAGSVAQIFTVEKAVLTIIANNAGMVYEQAMPALTATYTGFVNGDNMSTLTGSAIITTTASASSVVGVYPITVNGASGSNYDVIYRSGSLTIGQSYSAITFAALAAKSYGDNDFNLSATSTAGLPVIYSSSDNSVATLTGNTVHIVGAGNVIITASQTGNDNYVAAANVSQTLTITKANLTITADAQSKTYGDLDQPLTYKITNGTLFNGDTFIGSLTRDAGEQSGIYNIKQGTATLNKNYLLNYTPDKLTIKKAALIISANNTGIAYGQGLPALTVTYSGFVNGDNPGKLAAQIAVSTTATNTSAAGTYPINVGGAASNNYSFIYQPGILTIGQTNSSLTFANIPVKTYGDSDFILNATSTSGLAINYSSSDKSIAIVTGNSVHIIGAGTVIITASQPGDVNYTTANSVSQVLTINKALLTIAANNISIIYGQNLPVLTVTYAGFANGDNATTLNSPAVMNTTASASSTAGIYPINVNGASDNNYSINFQPGVLTIGQHNSSITFATVPAKTYGDADFTLTASSTSGLPVSYTSSDNNIAQVNGNMVHLIGAGNVNITASQAGNSNYSAAADVVQTLNISKANITISADVQSKTYGDADRPLTYKISNGTLFNSDTFTGSLIRDAGEQAANYKIKQGSVVLNNNYFVTYIDNKLTINKAALTVTAASSSIAYGQPLPALTFSYSGFVNGDDPGKLTAPVSISTSASFNSPVGAYPINLSGGASNNYSFNYQPGILTIGQNNSSISFAALPSKTYGDSDFILTSSSTSGLPVNYTSSDNNVATVTGNNLHITSAGTAVITAAQQANTNYTTAGSVAQIFTVNKAPLTIAANNINIAYGQTIPPLTATYTGFVNGDKATSLTVPAIISTSASANAAAGAYPITVSGAASNNYDIAYHPGTLTIGQNNSSITFAALAAKTYGDSDFDLTAVSTSGLPVTYTSSDNAVATVTGNTLHIIGAGSVSITASQTGNGNYTAAESVTQTLIVNKATLAITASNINVPFGDAIPTLTVTYNGFVNNDDAGKLKTPVVVSTTATANSPVGIYPIILTGASSNNYTVVYRSGTVTIGQTSSSINFAALSSKTYGDADFALISTSTSGLPITYSSSDNSIAIVNGFMVHIVSAGIVNITASQNGNSNYITAGNVTQALTINKAQLTAKANNINIAYGDAIPELTVTYSGFANGDDASKLTSAITVTTTAITGSAIGIYVITPVGGASTNYIINYQNGTLTIGQNSSSFTFADIPTKTYGDLDFALVSSSSSVSPVIYTCSDNNIATVNGSTVHIIGAGTVTITASQQSGIAASLTQTLTVNKKLLTVKANDINIVYGDNIPYLTVSYTGFVNGDDATKLTTSPGLSVPAVGGSAIGTYVISVKGATSKNYDFAYQPGTLTIGQNNSVTNLAQADDGISVHPAVSPNGDGINDFLMIQGIENYSSNKVLIVNRSGVLVSQMTGYDNSIVRFNGYSNITNAILQPGTYYYKIEYVANNETKSLTGFFILKY